MLTGNETVDTLKELWQRCGAQCGFAATVVKGRKGDVVTLKCDGAGAFVGTLSECVAYLFGRLDSSRDIRELKKQLAASEEDVYRLLAKLELERQGVNHE